MFRIGASPREPSKQERVPDRTKIFLGKNGIIRTCQESQCLPYAVFFLVSNHFILIIALPFFDEEGIIDNFFET